MDPETLPRIPVTGFSSLDSSFTSVRISVILYVPVIIVDLACSKLGSPKNAVTLIFPAGTVNSNIPFSSASVVPIGIQYVLGSLSVTIPVISSATSSPLKASLSMRSLAFGTGPIPSSSTVPERVAPL